MAMVEGWWAAAATIKEKLGAVTINGSGSFWLGMEVVWWGVGWTIIIFIFKKII